MFSVAALEKCKLRAQCSVTTYVLEQLTRKRLKYQVSVRLGRAGTLTHGLTTSENSLVISYAVKLNTYHTVQQLIPLLGIYLLKGNETMCLQRVLHMNVDSNFIIAKQ